MTDVVRFDYVGPLRIAFEDGAHFVLEMGTDALADDLVEKVHETFGGEWDDGWPQELQLHRVRVTFELLEREAPPPPPDPIVDFQGAPAPEGEYVVPTSEQREGFGGIA